jgi:hypothetical protein
MDTGCCRQQPIPITTRQGKHSIVKKESGKIISEELQKLPKGLIYFITYIQC